LCDLCIIYLFLLVDRDDIDTEKGINLRTTLAGTIKSMMHRGKNK